MSKVTHQVVTANRVKIVQYPDGRIVLKHDKQPAIEIPVTAAQIERWVLRQMREGMFA